MAESETNKKKTSTSIMPDWSELPEELLDLISKNLEDHCFDLVHARSVCSSWRSAFAFPSFLLCPSYTLPSYSHKRKDLCTLEKVPLFLFRIRTPTATDAKYLFGGIGRDESEDHMELPSPLQCSVKLKFPDFEPTLMNMLDCQIFPLGHEYRMNGSKGVAFLPLNNNENGGGEFVVLFNCLRGLFVLTSAEMRWTRVRNVPNAIYSHLVTFRGRFYVTFFTGEIFVMDPYSLEVTLLLLSPQKSFHYLVPSGNDELFLVERIYGVSDFSQFTCRVSRLDEEAGKWVEVSDLGDRLLFIGQLRNVSCLAKELPHDCGLSGNSILFTNEGNVTFPYKYGVNTANAEDQLNCWRPSRDNRVSILNNSSKVMTLFVNR